MKRRRRISLGPNEGFSLTELLVVLVIIGLLVLLAVPRFLGVTTRAKMTEAKLMLNQVYTLQIAYSLEHDWYSQSLEDLGFLPEVLVTDGGTARYVISITGATDTSFVALATSVVDFDKDGVMNVWEIDHNKKLAQAVPD